MGSINLDNVYQDPSFARLTLGAEVFREAGAYAQLVEPVHTRMNGGSSIRWAFSANDTGALFCAVMSYLTRGHCMNRKV